VNDFARMTDIPVAAREKLAACARADGLALKESLSSSDSDNSKVSATTLNGTSAYLIEGPFGDIGKMWATADGTAKPLQFEGADTSTGTSQKVTLTFSEWNSVKPFAAPPKSDISTP
jgi:hypothetical protein